MYLFLEDVIKFKYASLRTYFVKLHSKFMASRKSGSGTGDLSLPKWPWYQPLQFLKDTIEIGATMSTLSQRPEEVCLCHPVF